MENQTSLDELWLNYPKAGIRLAAPLFLFQLRKGSEGLQVATTEAVGALVKLIGFDFTAALKKAHEDDGGLYEGIYIGGLTKHECIYCCPDWSDVHEQMEAVSSLEAD